MFKNGLIKKIIVGITSLTFIVPLALVTGNINANAIAIRYVAPSQSKVNGVKNILPVNPNDHVYDNYLNGLYSLWSEPSYYRSARRTITPYRTYQLARDQVSFRILKRDPNSSNYYYFQSMHRHHYYAGWINAKDGAYRDLYPYDTKLRIRTYGNIYKRTKYSSKKSNHVIRNKHVAKHYRNSNYISGLNRKQTSAYYSLNREASRYVDSIGRGNSKNYRDGIRDAFLNTFNSNLKNNPSYKDGFVEFEYLQNKRETDSSNYGAIKAAKTNYSHYYEYGAPSIYQQIKTAF